MIIFDYFKLEITPAEPVLGGNKKKSNILRNTLILYWGVFVGVIGKYIFTLNIPGKKFDIAMIDPFWILIALIISAVIFPQVYKQAKLDIKKKSPMQFFIAIQNGFFWQSILEIIGKSISK